MTTPANLLVGCFTHPHGDGRGVVSVTLDPAHGSTVQGELELDDPAYIILDPTRPLGYALAERDPSALSTLDLSDPAAPVTLATVPTEGVGACHLGFDPTGRFVVVAHYGVGSVSVHPIGDDGAAGAPVSVWNLDPADASGAVPDRQEAPHAHMASAVDDEMYVPDLGADLIRRLRVGADGALEVLEPIRLPAGVGPRHFVIIDDLLIVACELAAEAWVARRDPAAPGGWREVQRVPATSTDVRPAYPSAITADGAAAVIMATRGPNTFTRYAVRSDADLPLTPVSETSCAGDWPRDLTVHGDLVLSANQNSHTVTVFERDGEGFTLAEAIPCPSPGCLVFPNVRPGA